MEPLFINTTTYNKEEIEKFSKFHKNKYIKKYVLFAIAFIIYMLILIIFNLANKNWKVVWGLIAIMVIIYIYYTQIRVERKQKNNKKLINEQFKFEFFDKYLIVNNKEKFNYFKFYRIFETNTHFYMYFNKEYSFIINKKGFVKGRDDEFREFIKKKCKFKYKK